MNFSKLLSFVVTSLIVAPSLGATITDASQVASKTFDYVIVGGGTAGLVVASRLTENPNVSVLVLEAGISDEGIFQIQVPFLGPTVLPNTPLDWNYTIVPQAGMNGRTFAYPRGKLLGGSSSANYLFHQYGTDEDWNRLGSVSGDAGWSWSNMKKYVQKHEKFTPPVDGHNTTGQFIPKLHGFNGLTSVSLPGASTPLDPRVINATQTSSEYPFNQDMSGGDHSLLGIGWLQSSAGGGVRSSSSTSYLAPANSRPNLTVLVNATVMKLIQTGTKNGVPSFKSVQFGSSPGTGSTPGGGAPTTVSAKKEVILSAGSVGTTQILQLSGIGNQRDLQAVKIKTIVNSPKVGYNLGDHTLLPNLYNVQPGSSFDDFLRDPNQINDAVNQWVTTKTGRLANNVVNNFGFARLPRNATIFKKNKDPAPGPKSPHWEVIFGNFWFNPGIPQPSTGDFLVVVSVLLNPTSRGTIKLKSNNPFDKPLIDPNYLTTDLDIFTMRESVKSINRFLAEPTLSNYVVSRFGDNFVSADDDSSIDAYVRSLTTTIFHPVGTASISSKNSNNGVVNPDLTVKGADGLRVIDASVFPFVPSSHTQGPVYLLAERASDIIKAAKY
ncbi:GMC oxidoreductase [Hebeloma cylindrosporum]|uniref:pyranose dehydrogenase (acceptor) n=1 Tax=Hebeloma cylindrosporum TaxID=76867 RepID=A0A0C2YPH7_HEBCY|nr:GMC oxidoreductase [Hebeloma cylindrosporum h7]